MKISKGYANVFEALEDDPAVAKNLKIRSALMIEIEKFIKDNKLTQSAAAEVLGVSQPRVSDLVTGKINKFTIDMLVNMLTRADIPVELKVA